MAFDNLSEKLQNAFKKLKGQGVLTEKNLKESLREIKLALLEADVNFKVVKDFIAAVQERALGQDVMKSLTPGQQVVKIVREELVALMGTEEEAKLQYGDTSHYDGRSSGRRQNHYGRQAGGHAEEKGQEADAGRL